MIVYSPTRNSVLPNKSAKLFCLQNAYFKSARIALPVIVVYIVVYIFKQQGGEREMPALDE